ncbi:MAG: sigma-70 family RNA polymerase sigma factor [Muribaculaceae bacterium]|nr:sigma-70 family RNA polymerase sigma factor [Muribaculaceae bacterium]
MIKPDTQTEKDFEETMVAFGGVITKICYYFSTDTEEYQDLRQEVLMNIWKGWNNFRGDAKLSTWIYRISFNTCLSYQRKNTRKYKSISINEILNIAEEEEPSRMERYNEMHRLIQQLNYEDRALILLWLDEKSYEEIGELMGINRNTLAVRLKRIKEKIVRLSQQNID